MKDSLYKEITEELRRRIRTHAYPPGSRMPGHTKIAAEFNVSSITSNRALRELMKEKLIERVERVGSFVCKERKLTKVTLISDAAPQNYSYMQGCIEKCSSLGIEANSHIIKKPISESDFMKLPIGDGIIVIVGNPDIYLYLEKMNIPTVFVGIKDAARYCITVDFKACARDIAISMIKNGSSRIGFIGNLASANHLLARDGYLEGTIETGIGYRYIRDASLATLEAVIHDLLADDLKVDSLIIAGGQMPIAALPSIYSINSDIRLGFICENSALRLLSSIAYRADFSMEDTGAAAVNMLAERYSGTLDIPQIRYMPYQILSPSR